MNFEPDQHLHIGYYENGFDLEATAYKIAGEGKWVIFLDSDQDLTTLNNALYNYERIDKFGYKIFTVNIDDLSYEDGLEKFTEWLRSHKIIQS
ncbi:seryl-tRNA synthetase [Peribacillus simplex]|uniref:DUF3986 family protein n=1 Tax=Peribacillus simplex TaxID=1478 RepID=UPI0024E1C383|nr:DUF3986 family protein [Peribacillus simplex]MDF9763784.1 seryl-tRNA synthetase [Peribacillus simplex]